MLIRTAESHSLRLRVKIRNDIIDVSVSAFAVSFIRREFSVCKFSALVKKEKKNIVVKRSEKEGKKKNTSNATL